MPLMYEIRGNPTQQLSGEIVGFPDRIPLDTQAQGQDFLVANWNPSGAGEPDSAPRGLTWALRPDTEPDSWDQNLGLILDNGFGNLPILHSIAWFGDNCYVGRPQQINGRLWRVVERLQISASLQRSVVDVVVFPGEILCVVVRGSDAFNFGWLSWTRASSIRDTTGFVPAGAQEPDEPFTPLPAPLPAQSDLQQVIDLHVRSAFSAAGVPLPDDYQAPDMASLLDEDDISVDEPYPDPFDDAHEEPTDTVAPIPSDVPVVEQTGDSSDDPPDSVDAVLDEKPVPPEPQVTEATAPAEMIRSMWISHEHARRSGDTDFADELLDRIIKLTNM